MPLMDMTRPMRAIDIETVTQGKRAKELHDRTHITAAANIKDPERIKANIDKKRAALGSKDALNWHLGKVLSYAWEDVQTGEQGFFTSMKESEVLTQFAIDTVKFNLIGKESRDFDFPFLIGRYMANNMAIPAVLKDMRRLYDCNDFLSYSRSCSQRVKLDHYAHGLGIAPKTMTGSGVADLYNRMITGSEEIVSAAIETLKEYNIHDSHIVAEMTRRYNRSAEV